MLDINMPKLFKGRSVHIVSRNIVVRDAVGNFALGLSNLLRKYGATTFLYAKDWFPEDVAHILPWNALPETLLPADTILYTYSIYDEHFFELANLHCSKKILYFHNVTPGSFFRPYSPNFADILDNSKEQFHGFSRFDAVIANSQFSIEAIRPYIRSDTCRYIFPPYTTMDHFEKRLEAVALPRTAHMILWIGRITPHKRPEMALQILQQLASMDVDAALVFVGSGRHDFPSFEEFLDKHLAELPENVHARVLFLENLSEGQLAFLYSKASLLLCTSAHEGYCMPLAEAAAFGLPVAAMPQPAVLETLNGGGIILNEDSVAAAVQIKDFLTTADEAKRRTAVPVLKCLPTDELVHLIAGDS